MNTTTSAEWHFVYLMPHLAIQKAIEWWPLAIVPFSDERLVRMSARSNAVSALVNKFSDQFGGRTEPCALVTTKTPIDFEAVVAFRNSVGISDLLSTWARGLADGKGPNAWSDYFDFYPFVPSTDNDLLSHSLASRVLNRCEEFTGQTAPHLPKADRFNFERDEGLLRDLYQRWRIGFLENKRDWANRVLFRSLEIAMLALRVPGVGVRGPTIHDIGIQLALWVSAIEILSHPWQKPANLDTVIALLSRYHWEDPWMKAKRYRVASKGKKKVRHSVNLVQRLYSRLYRARNAFLHGNAVTFHSLNQGMPFTFPTLLHPAPIIFRTALREFVPRAISRNKSKDVLFEEALGEAHIRSLFEAAFLNNR